MSVKIIRASEAGAKLDSDVTLGGGTDDTAVLQAVLDAAQDSGIHLIMDGAARITGLKLYSNTTIECLNKRCGFYLADQTNGPLFRNAHPDFRVIRDENIRIIGGTYNHNCQNQQHDIPIQESIYADMASDMDVFEGTHWPRGFDFFGVEGLSISGITLRDQRTFGMLIANWKHVELRDILIDLPHHMDAQNQDGIHFWGPGQFLSMQNICGTAGDDFIALAPDEHDRKSAITDVYIDGVFLDASDQGIRLLSREKGRLDRVTIRNVTGTYKSFGFYIDAWFPGAYCGNFGNIRFENIDLRPLEPNYTYRSPFLFKVGGHIEHLTICNLQDHYSEHQRALIEVSGPICPAYTPPAEQAPTHIEELTVDGLTIMQKNESTVPAVVLDAAVDKVVLRNVDVRCGKKGTTALIHVGDHGDIGLLALNGVLTENVNRLIRDDNKAIDRTVMWNVCPDPNAAPGV